MLAAKTKLNLRPPLPPSLDPSLSATITYPWMIGACAVCFASDRLASCGHYSSVRWASACVWLVLPAFAHCARACM